MIRDQVNLQDFYDRNLYQNPVLDERESWQYSRGAGYSTGTLRAR